MVLYVLIFDTEVNKAHFGDLIQEAIQLYDSNLKMGGNAPDEFIVNEPSASVRFAVNSAPDEISGLVEGYSFYVEVSADHYNIQTHFLATNIITALSLIAKFSIWINEETKHNEIGITNKYELFGSQGYLLSAIESDSYWN